MSSFNWPATSGIGGPTSATDNAVVRFDGTTGQLIQNSGVLLDDSENLSGIADLNATTASLSNLTDNRALKSGTSGELESSTVTTTELEYLSGVTSAIQAQFSALSSIITNFEWQPSALDYIVDNTVVPPTEVSGNRYVLSHDGGAPHANWDGASAGDIVEFNGTTWDATTPTIGTFIAIDDETDSLRLWGGAAWSVKNFEQTTASLGLTKVGFDIRLDATAAGDGLALTTGALSVNVDDVTIETNADALRLKDLGITDAKVSATADIVSTKLKDGQTFMRNACTGLLTGGLVSINADPTKYDISAGTGVITDTTSDISNPTTAEVSWSAFTAQTPANIGTQIFTYLAINSGGSIVELNTLPTASFRRANIIVGLVSHDNMTTITLAGDRPQQAAEPQQSLLDLAFAIDVINVSGNIYSSNGANLNVNKSVGSSFLPGLNFHNDETDPNVKANPSAAALTFFYIYQDGSGGSTVVPSQTAIDPDQYDDGSGTLASVANNKWTIQRVVMEPALDQHIFLYSQNVYNSLVEAEQAISTEAFNTPAFLSQGQSFRGWLVVKKGATDLSDSAVAKFINAGKFGAEGGGGSAVTGTTNLQEAYDNSIDPEMVLDTIRGAFNIQDNATPIAADLFAVSNNGGSTDYLKVDTTGVTSTAFHGDGSDLTNVSQGTATAKVADYVVLDADGIRTVLMTTAGTNRTVTLPTASANNGRELTIIKVDSGTGRCIIDGEGTESINGKLTVDLYAQYDRISLICDGSNWLRTEGEWNAVDVSSDVTFNGGFTSVTSKSFRMVRQGSYMRIYGKAVLTTAGAAAGALVLPYSLNIDTSGLTTQKDSFGSAFRIQSTGTTTIVLDGGNAGYFTWDSASNTQVSFSRSTSSSVFEKTNISSWCSSGNSFSIDIIIPISEWS